MQLSDLLNMHEITLIVKYNATGHPYLLKSQINVEALGRASLKKHSQFGWICQHFFALTHRTLGRVENPATKYKWQIFHILGPLLSLSVVTLPFTQPINTVITYGTPPPPLMCD